MPNTALTLPRIVGGVVLCRGVAVVTFRTMVTTPRKRQHHPRHRPHRRDADPDELSAHTEPNAASCKSTANDRVAGSKVSDSAA